MKICVFLLLILSVLIFADEVPTKYDTLIFAEDFENGLDGWITKDYSDSKPMWHIDTYNALGDSGHSWWCGTADSMLLASAPGYGKMWQQYLLHPFDLSSAVAPVTLSFYHLYDTEIYLGPDGYIGSDGGTVQVSVDDGQTWQAIEPIGSYPYQNITSFLHVHDQERLDGFSGKITEWEKVHFNLDAFIGKQVKIRWYFASDYAADDYDMPIDSLYFKFMDQFSFSPIVKFDSDGAWYLDNIKLRDANEILFFDDVEEGINEWRAEYELFTQKTWQSDRGNVSPINGQACLRCVNEAPVNPVVEPYDLRSMNALEGIFSPVLDLSGMNKVYVTFWARASYGTFNDHNFYVDKSARMVPANFYQVDFDFGREYDENLVAKPEAWIFRSYDISQFSRNELVRLLFNYCWINQEGMTGLAIDDLKIYASSRFQHDLAIADIELSDSLQVGTLSMFNIKLINAGTDTLKRKLVSWSQTVRNAAGEVIYEYSGLKPVPSNFSPDSITYFNVSESKAWTPNEPGQYEISAVVSYPEEVNTKNDTLTKFITVQNATGVHQNDIGLLPSNFNLHPNYPNPFNPQTQISYDVPENSQISIVIFNSLGQKVKMLVNSKQNPGHYEIVWDGTNDYGERLGTGIYLCKMQGKDFSEIIKLALVK